MIGCNTFKGMTLLADKVHEQESQCSRDGIVNAILIYCCLCMNIYGCVKHCDSMKSNLCDHNNYLDLLR